MILKRTGFPEEGSLVLCTVTNVQFHSVFVNLDEYSRQAMIHISEIAPGRIRNIRDYVVEGKKVVCTVLRVSQEKGYIDLSLRRVNEGERRRKLEEIKLEQLAEKIVELAAKEIKVPMEKLYGDITKQVFKEYSLLHHFFQDVSKDPKLMDSLSIPEQAKKIFAGMIEQRFAPTEVSIMGQLNLTSYDPKGVDVIRKALIDASETDKESVSIIYSGGGRYRVIVKADDYKQAEKIIKQCTETAIEYVQKHHGIGTFERAEAK